MNTSRTSSTHRQKIKSLNEDKEWRISRRKQRKKELKEGKFKLDEFWREKINLEKKRDELIAEKRRLEQIKDNLDEEDRKLNLEEEELQRSRDMLKEEVVEKEKTLQKQTDTDKLSRKEKDYRAKMKQLNMRKAAQDESISKLKREISKTRRNVDELSRKSASSAESRNQQDPTVREKQKTVNELTLQLDELKQSTGYFKRKMAEYPGLDPDKWEKERQMKVIDSRKTKNQIAETQKRINKLQRELELQVLRRDTFVDRAESIGYHTANVRNARKQEINELKKRIKEKSKFTAHLCDAITYGTLEETTLKGDLSNEGCSLRQVIPRNSTSTEERRVRDIDIHINKS
ncbi:hypothetical protein WR25_24055 [Diploscapter pachys]|uniref:Uncharacterized protein n=1 Tax=Diploscapter pachys TaxID=2018661 RepID=A0A2A2LBE0_9BILA|nr:hypothetical protein WR25_24055 [Diploscapter pachys]